MSAEDRAPKECYSCGHQGLPLIRREPPPHSENREPNWFCPICARTTASDAYIYPSMAKEIPPLHRTIAGVGAALLEEIRSQRLICQTPCEDLYTWGCKWWREKIDDSVPPNVALLLTAVAKHLKEASDEAR